MAKFDSVTVVSVAGEGDGRNAVYAIKTSMDHLPGSKGLLIAAERPDNLGDSIQFESIGYLDYYQYALYAIQCLYYHIRTDYILKVEQDGWVLDGNNWSDDWFNYDYIGAPCPIGAHDGKLLHNFAWVGLDGSIPVQCGGFSWRSRALLEAPTKYGICYKISNIRYMLHEDVQLCVSLRGDLEKRGLRIAPLATALDFCIEYMHPVLHREVDLHRIFGHHGRTRKIREGSVVETGITQAQMDRIFGENRIVALLEEYGYVVRREWPSNGTATKEQGSRTSIR